MTAEPPVNNPPSEPASPGGEDTPPPKPATSLSDPRAVQILATEHWSLLAGRSLVYNEAFTRGGMFLAFLSMSFVGTRAARPGRCPSPNDFLVISAVVLAFDFVIGLLTFVRIAGTGADDLRHVHGMARIRHAYTEIAPPVVPYLTTAAHDDIPSVLTAYGPQSTSSLGDVLYGLSTSLGLVGLITAMVGGVLASVTTLLFGLSGVVALLVGAAVAVITVVAMVTLTFSSAAATRATLEARFPAPAATDAPSEKSSTSDRQGMKGDRRAWRLREELDLSR